MHPDVKETSQEMRHLLETARRQTLSAFSGSDAERIVHHDRAAWRVRDVLGHLGAWNGEAARSLQAHAQGGEYHCIPSEAEYDQYNASAAAERHSWSLEQVWAEYESSSSQLISGAESMPAEKWSQEMLYPWNERGTVRNLIEVMVLHESEHRDKLVCEVHP